MGDALRVPPAETENIRFAKVFEKPLLGIPVRESAGDRSRTARPRALEGAKKRPLAGGRSIRAICSVLLSYRGAAPCSRGAMFTTGTPRAFAYRTVYSVPPPRPAM